MSDVYSENILDHYHSPRNYGTLAKSTHASHGDNPVCGDDIGMQLIVGKDGTIVDVKFSGEGCAIS
ncbi:MAG: iron-sulfur cluster assembly scaffold protein, partial [Candidatus Micrarchaeia archaeon]